MKRPSVLLLVSASGKEDSSVMWCLNESSSNSTIDQCIILSRDISPKINLNETASMPIIGRFTLFKLIYGLRTF